MIFFRKILSSDGCFSWIYPDSAAPAAISGQKKRQKFLLEDYCWLIILASLAHLVFLREETKAQFPGFRKGFAVKFDS